MTQASLAGVSRRRFVTTTVKDGGRQAPDLVERNFTAEAPDRLWVADITYIPTWTGFLYLAVVLDAYSRRIVGWSMATTLATQLVLDALNLALLTRRPAGVIHHSDQGSQYTSIEFGHRCCDAGVRPSMGSVGDAYDNAMCESFFATLECELLARHRFKTQTEARNATFAFIEGFYNRRRHSSIGYLSPIDYERRHHAPAVDPDAHQPAVVLATVKDKPSGRPQDAAVLDRRCARPPHHRAGRDGRMARHRRQRAVKSERLIPKLSPLHETGVSTHHRQHHRPDAPRFADDGSGGGNARHELCCRARGSVNVGDPRLARPGLVRSRQHTGADHPLHGPLRTTRCHGEADARQYARAVSGGIVVNLRGLRDL